MAGKPFYVDETVWQRAKKEWHERAWVPRVIADSVIFLVGFAIYMRLVGLDEALVELVIFLAFVVGAGLVGEIASVGVSLVAAPYWQRNEARRHIKQLEAERDAKFPVDVALGPVSTSTKGISVSDLPPDK